MYDEIFFQEAIVQFLGEEKAKEFELKKLATEYSNYYTSDECFEFVVFVSRRFKRSPWSFGYVKSKVPKNIIHCILNAENKAISNEVAMTNASKDFFLLKELKAKKTHNKVEGIKSIYASLSVQEETDQVIKTPAALLKKLHDRYLFDFDPCPIEPMQDAMLIEWGNMNYINPPFKHAQAFVAKAIEQAIQLNKKSVFLIPVPLTSGWFSNALSTNCIQKIIFLRSGIKFDGYKNRCPLPLCLIEIEQKEVPNRQNYVCLETEFWDPVQDIMKRKVKSHPSKSF